MIEYFFLCQEKEESNREKIEAEGKKENKQIVFMFIVMFYLGPLGRKALAKGGKNILFKCTQKIHSM